MDVTVLLTTYNHKGFIAESVESVLMQETNFNYEIVIIEDCSTDGTTDLVLELEQRHPEKIRLLLSPDNRCDNRAFAKAFAAAPGRYIALLDGDDFWTSTQKLQRQVDFLESHPSCSLCFHNVEIFYQDGTQPSWNRNGPDQKTISDLTDILEVNFIMGCSPMMRKASINGFPDWYLDEPLADWALYIMAAQNGDIGYIAEVMGGYRIHANGYWSSKSPVQQLEIIVDFYRRIDVHLGCEYSGLIRAKIADWYVMLTGAGTPDVSRTKDECPRLPGRIWPDSPNR